MYKLKILLKKFWWLLIAIAVIILAGLLIIFGQKDSASDAILRLWSKYRDIDRDEQIRIEETHKKYYQEAEKLEEKLEERGREQDKILTKRIKERLGRNPKKLCKELNELLRSTS